MQKLLAQSLKWYQEVMKHTKAKVKILCKRCSENTTLNAAKRSAKWAYERLIKFDLTVLIGETRKDIFGCFDLKVG